MPCITRVDVAPAFLLLLCAGGCRSVYGDGGRIAPNKKKKKWRCVVAAAVVCRAAIRV